MRRYQQRDTKLAEEQNSLKEDIVKLKKKIETKFKMVYLKKNESTRIIERVREREGENQGNKRNIIME